MKPTPSTDYEGRCGNCHKELNEADKYCRYCGTPRGQGSFKPYLNAISFVYGPRPIMRRHTCRGCGNTWTTCLMLDNEKYCPLCGGSRVDVTAEK